MAVFTWPSSLGSPRVDGMTFTHPGLVGSRQTMRGPPRFIRDRLTIEDTIQLSFWFTATQMETFENFWWETLDAGAHQVSIPMWTILGQVNITVWTSPYSWRYDEILQAVEVNFEAKYMSPALTMLSALLV